MMRCPFNWEIYRRPDPWEGRDMGDRSNGFLLLPKRGMKIIFSNGGGWEHVSVSFPDRCPTWEEMDDVKTRFWEATDTVMQLHVPASDHRSLHPYCLHLWRPLNADIPRPPGIFVAPDSSIVPRAELETTCTCGEKLSGHEDESGNQCRWCATGWKKSPADGVATAETISNTGEQK